MTITQFLQGIITAGAALGALTAFIALFVKAFRWVDRQKKQDQELEALRNRHETDNGAIQEELTLLNYGVLACLKGLKEQGCNGPVTKAIDKIEKHLNQKAHHQEVHHEQD
jgi:hypothetical protein